MMITGRMGGTSGPIWGTAFLRAAAIAGEKSELTLTRSFPCFVQRSKASNIAARLRSGTRHCSTHSSLRSTSSPKNLAEEQMLKSLSMPPQPPPTVARRPPGRCSPSVAAPAYAGERSIGTLDAGAVAVALMFNEIAEKWATHAPDRNWRNEMKKFVQRPEAVRPRDVEGNRAREPGPSSPTYRNTT